MARMAYTVSCSAGKFDVVFTYDVLHDATDPEELMRLVRSSLGDGGVWVIADIKTCGCTACREAARLRNSRASLLSFVIKDPAS